MAEITVRAARLKAGSENRQTAVRIMVRLLETGGTVVIGTDDAVSAGTIIGEADGRTLIVKARSTRQAFLLHAPARVIDSTAGRAPFYYELELKAEATA